MLNYGYNEVNRKVDSIQLAIENIVNDVQEIMDDTYCKFDSVDKSIHKHINSIDWLADMIQENIDCVKNRIYSEEGRDRNRLRVEAKPMKIKSLLFPREKEVEFRTMEELKKIWFFSLIFRGPHFRFFEVHWEGEKRILTAVINSDPLTTSADANSMSVTFRVQICSVEGSDINGVFEDLVRGDF